MLLSEFQRAYDVSTLVNTKRRPQLRRSEEELEERAYQAEERFQKQKSATCALRMANAIKVKATTQSI